MRSSPNGRETLEEIINSKSPFGFRNSSQDDLLFRLTSKCFTDLLVFYIFLRAYQNPFMNQTFLKGNDSLRKTVFIQIGKPWCILDDRWGKVFHCEVFWQFYPDRHIEFIEGARMEISFHHNCCTKFLSDSPILSLRKRTQKR